MAFQISGSLTGSPVILRNYQIGETMYVGQLAMSGLVGTTGGHVQIADGASEAHENDQPILGVVMGAFKDGVYSGTYNGDGVTYDTALADVLANTHKDAAMVQVARIIPGDTLVRGSLFDTTYKTALTVLTEDSGDGTGLTITHSETVADAADYLSTIYCRSGANKGMYRVVTNGGTGAQVCTIAFPFAIAIGDTFVRASCVLGLGGLDIASTANFIDGDAALSNYYDVDYQQINLEEAGKEWASFVFKARACGPLAA